MRSRFVSEEASQLLSDYAELDNMISAVEHLLARPMRRSEVRFGKYHDLQGVAVHAYVEGCDWWLRRALRVELDGGPQVWTEVAECAEAAARIEHRVVPLDMAPKWFQATAPVALQLPNPALPVHVDMIAARVEDGQDVAYPFVLREQDNRVVCGFSGAGPESSTRAAIVTAVACRLIR